jgi:hypothetical protein
MAIDWEDYIKTSLSYGCNPNTIKHRVESAVGDCFGSKYREEVMKRMKELFMNKKRIYPWMEVI